MKIGLDTSVVLRLLIGEPAAQAERAWQSLSEARAAGDVALVSDLVVSETYFALQYHYRVPKEEALEQMRALFGSGHVSSAGCAVEVLKTPGLHTANPGFVDRLIHAEYVHRADRILTFERAAGKLSQTQVLRA